jgi:hypothetical protein
MNLRQFAEPSLETDRVLDDALSVDHCRACGRVSVMGVHKIGDEKKHGRTARLKGIGLNSTLRTGRARLHVMGHSLVSDLEGF